MQKKSNYILPILIIGALFFIFGFVSWLNGILIPYLQIACELSDFQALFVTFAFYIAYTIMSLPSAKVLAYTGFKNGITIGLWVIALGALIFVFAALSRTYLIFLTGLYIMGTGLALLQTAVNPYITEIGPSESAANRMSIMGICNKVAGALAPLIFSFFILNEGDTLLASLSHLSGTEKNIALDELAAKAINPYLVMTAVLFLFGILIRFIRLPEQNHNSIDKIKEASGNKSSVFQFPHLITGAIVLFLYMGAEVIAADTIIRYGLSIGIELNHAKLFTTYTMGFMVLGYGLGIVLIPKWISQQLAMKLSGLLGILFSFGIVLSQGFISVMFVALLGLANAMVWPAMWPLALKNLGKLTNTGSALLVMAISGGAIIPLLWGYLSDIQGTQNAYWMLLPLYVSVLYYGLKGYKLKVKIG